MEKHRENRGWRVISTGITMLVRAAVIAALIGLSLYGFFKIKAIEVTGNQIYPYERLIAESGVEIGEQMVKAMLDNVSGRIREALPAVEKIRLHISFPDTLVLEVTESKVMLAVRTETGDVHMTSDGRVVSGYRSEAGQILLKGLNILEYEDGKQVVLGEEDTGKLSYISELLTLLDERGILSKIKEIDISNVAALRFNYDNRLTVRIGGPDMLSNKIRFLEDILKELDSGETGTLDLTKASEGHFIPG